MRGSEHQPGCCPLPHLGGGRGALPGIFRAGEGTGCPFLEGLRPEGHVLVMGTPVPQSTEGLE